jgi:predicted glycosyltransferase
VSQSLVLPGTGQFESKGDLWNRNRLVKKDGSNFKVWIDLENSPHVPFFLPIIRELEARGCEMVLTARDCFQVCELADMVGLKYHKIGRHYGKNRVAKVTGLGIRVQQLARIIAREKPDISVSHGSRSLIVLSAILGLKNVLIVDYEHADLHLTRWLNSARKKWIMTPAVIPTEIFERNGILKDHVLHYPGIKEDVYVPDFKPDSSIRSNLGLKAEDVVVVIRPPATEAHYHNPESEKLLNAVFELLRAHPETKTILLPRTPKQGAELRSAYPDLFSSGMVHIPEHAINGLDLIWLSDVVISGGGTMNREAAALGVPVYSLFRGTLGAVDQHLAETGRLVLLQSERDVMEKLALKRRKRPTTTDAKSGDSLNAVVEHVAAILEDGD